MTLTKTSFFKFMAIVGLLGLWSGTAMGQSDRLEIRKKVLPPTAEVSPEAKASKILKNRAITPMSQLETTNGQSGQTPGNGASTEAQWDIVYQFSATDTVGQAGLAGAYWTGSEFWISAWNSADLWRLDGNGAIIQGPFSIPGLSNVRSFTTDGSGMLYTGSAANLGQIINVVDPATQTLGTPIQLTGTSVSPRAITYDPNLDNGNGGFWLANFTSDIEAVDMSGNFLSSIPQATHGRVGIYGLAVDGFSQGGPYLWVFEQPGAPTDGVISQLNLATGAFTGVSRDVATDLGAAGGLAGGLFVIEDYTPGVDIIGGMLQNGPDLLFGLELDFSVIQVDAAISNMTIDPGFPFVPQAEAPPFTFGTTIQNLGQQTLATADVNFDVLDVNGSVFNQTNSFPNLANLQSQPLNFGPWTATANGDYIGRATVGTGAQMDENSQNDTTFSPIITVNDSVMGRDDGIVFSALSVGSGPNANSIMGQNFETQNTAWVTSVSVFLAFPAINTTVFASVFATDATGAPTGTPIANSELYTVTADDTVGGVFLTLPFTSGPVPVQGGQEFFIGLNELGDGFGMAYSQNIFTPASTWIRSDSIGGGGWFALEQFNFNVAFVLRANFGPCWPQYMSADITETDDDGSGNATLSVAVTGGTAPYTYSWNDPLAQSTDTATNLTGGTTYDVTVVDSKGCTVTVTSDSVNVWTTSLERELAAGISNLVAYPNPSKDIFNIDLVLADRDDVSIQIMDLNGRTIYRDELRATLDYQKAIDLRSHASGIYVLQVSTSKGMTTRRLALD